MLWLVTWINIGLLCSLYSSGWRKKDPLTALSLANTRSHQPQWVSLILWIQTLFSPHPQNHQNEYLWEKNLRRLQGGWPFFSLPFCSKHPPMGKKASKVHCKMNTPKNMPIKKAVKYYSNTISKWGDFVIKPRSINVMWMVQHTQKSTLSVEFVQWVILTPGLHYYICSS